MSTINNQFFLSQGQSGLGVGGGITRSTLESGFVADAPTVTTTPVALTYSGITVLREVGLKLISGDDLLISLDGGSTYPLSLHGVGQGAMLPIESREVSTVVAGADTASSLSGKYFDLNDFDGTVRVWMDMAATAAFGSITYGVPVISDTVVVNGTTCTYVAAAPTANQFSNIAELEALIEAIALVTSTQNGTVVSIVADTAGTAGNAITLALGGGNAGTMAISGATLSGGSAASTAPTAPTTGRLLSVVIVEGSANTVVGAAINSALNADGQFFSTLATATLTITNAGPGILTNVSAGDTGWTVSSGGTSVPSIYFKSLGTSVVTIGRAPI